ncbi:NAD-dependent succinate-semialdehyde dehydrogenase [uncultured Aquimarina sp.]|uniref:NAD-dependent succinate-semialdehyde dehydrogenase n=1 Tax=uncultured Aquimarina sp. TaxID=575652 RepID=UPI002631BC64|nr:NAD-dependent succinate-semialdehyde dehydrogenase [uncultured Aquimarina sp.]
MKNKIQTNFPFTGEVLNTYDLFTDDQIENALEKSAETFTSWRKVTLKEKVEMLARLSDILEENKKVCANLITLEMGKPFKQSIAEIDKCIWLINFYAKNAEQFLSDELIETDAEESFISKDPLGIIFGIMPWNYPFWQALRFAIPTITAGNTIVLKHANNVLGSALMIEDIFRKAGYPEYCFQTIIATHDQVEDIIGDDRIKGVSFTGSEKAGKKIAELAGKYLKKIVLELGGSNACIISEDADLDKYIDTIVKARLQNTGQSCIAAKRYIVEEKIYDKFLEYYNNGIQKLKFGDPLHHETDIATMAREDLAEEVEQQITESVNKGAKIFIGGKRDKAYIEPTILTDVTPDMPVFNEEVFGPVASIIKAENLKHAIQLASNSKYGLGTMVFTEDQQKVRELISEIPDGALFVNEMVKSDPRLPFGGTKASGYGRELSKEGILEFVNKKTVYIK